MAVLLKVPLYSGTPKCGHAEIRTPHSGVGRCLILGGGVANFFFVRYTCIKTRANACF